MKNILLTAAAVALMAVTPALASGNSGNNGNGPPQGGDGGDGGTATALGLGLGVAQAGASAGAAAGASSSTKVGVGVDASQRTNQQSTNLGIQVDASRQQLSTGPASAGASTGPVDASSKVSLRDGDVGVATGPVDVRGGDVNVTGDSYKIPVAQAFAAGSGGGGACPRFGPGAAYQGITGAVGLSLTIFKDADCVMLVKAEKIAEFAGAEAAVQYLSRMDKDIREAVRTARTPR